MSIAAPRPMRNWLPVFVAMTIGLAAGIGASVVEIWTSGQTDSVAGTQAAPDALQADWKIRFERGAVGSRATEDALDERPAVEEAITTFYDALLLDRARLDSVIGESFAPGAAGAIASTRVGLHPSVDGIRIRSRRARLGIQIDGGRRAVAVVRIRAEGTADGRRIAVFHRSTMWLEKKSGSWRIIAFDIKQKPR